MEKWERRQAFWNIREKKMPGFRRKSGLKTFKEFKIPQKRRSGSAGARCMNCGVPLCQSAMKLSGMVTGCPAAQPDSGVE
jgi:hypothetical protein